MAVVSIATALSGVNIAAQSQAAREEALRHIAAAKQAADMRSRIYSTIFARVC
jgi:hypothetical protein